MKREEAINIVTSLHLKVIAKNLTNEGQELKEKLTSKIFN